MCNLNAILFSRPASVTAGPVHHYIGVEKRHRRLFDHIFLNLLAALFLRALESLRGGNTERPEALRLALHTE